MDGDFGGAGGAVLRLVLLANIGTNALCKTPYQPRYIGLFVQYVGGVLLGGRSSVVCGTGINLLTYTTMANKSNIQGAEVAQAMASTTSTTDNLNGNKPIQPQPITPPSYVIADLLRYGDRLFEVLDRFSATDYLAQLQTMDFEYKDVLHAIDAGGGIERDHAEDPAQVLAYLREAYTLTPRRMVERANLLRCMADMLCTVEELVQCIEYYRKTGRI